MSLFEQFPELFSPTNSISEKEKQEQVLQLFNTNVAQTNANNTLLLQQSLSQPAHQHLQQDPAQNTQIPNIDNGLYLNQETQSQQQIEINVANDFGEFFDFSYFEPGEQGNTAAPNNTNDTVNQRDTNTSLPGAPTPSQFSFQDGYYQAPPNSVDNQLSFSNVAGVFPDAQNQQYQYDQFQTIHGPSYVNPYTTQQSYNPTSFHSEDVDLFWRTQVSNQQTSVPSQQSLQPAPTNSSHRALNPNAHDFVPTYAQERASVSDAPNPSLNIIQPQQNLEFFRPVGYWGPVESDEEEDDEVEQRNVGADVPVPTTESYSPQLGGFDLTDGLFSPKIPQNESESGLRRGDVLSSSCLEPISVHAQHNVANPEPIDAYAGLISAQSEPVNVHEESIGHEQHVEAPHQSRPCDDTVLSNVCSPVPFVRRANSNVVADFEAVGITRAHRQVDRLARQLLNQQRSSNIAAQSNSEPAAFDQAEADDEDAYLLQDDISVQQQDDSSFPQAHASSFGKKKPTQDISKESEIPPHMTVVSTRVVVNAAPNNSVAPVPQKKKNLKASVYTTSKRQPDPRNGLYYQSFADVFEEDEAQAFKCPLPDDDLPNDAPAMRTWVIKLVNAIRNTTNTKEKPDTQAFANRWGHDATFYNTTALEKMAWRILHYCIELHSNGWKWQIYDDNVMSNILETKDWKFKQRLNTIIDLLTVSKRTCEDLMKMAKMLEVIGSPQAFMTRTASNAPSNDKKAVRIARATALEKEEKRKREGRGDRSPTLPKRKMAKKTHRSNNITPDPAANESMYLMSGALQGSDLINFDNKRKRGDDFDDDDDDDCITYRTSTAPREKLKTF